MNKPVIDPLFRVECLAKYGEPQQIAWAALHQDYSEDFVYDVEENYPSNKRAGEVAVNRLLKGDRGHYGPLEHSHITLNVGYFPHSTMQQLRTHRWATFDVQSGRYSGQRVVDVVNGERDVCEVFYVRPVGEYTNRAGKRYSVTEFDRKTVKNSILSSCNRYAAAIDSGWSEEHARCFLPWDIIRQHFVVTVNIRSLMHLLDLRWKKDAQLECQWFCDLLFKRFEDWAPEIASWYLKDRAQKARLSP